MYDYGAKGVEAWLNDRTRPKSLTRLNMKYLGELKQCSMELGRCSQIAYFLAKRTDLKAMKDNVVTMLNSTVKQNTFVKRVMVDLRKYGVRPEDTPLFEKQVNALYVRCDWVFKILRENVRLTEYHPYFTAVGYERLISYARATRYGDATEEDALAKEIEEWNMRHREEVEGYKASIADEVARYEARRREQAEAAEEEKRIRRELRKAESAEVKEIQENAKKHRAREKKIDRSFERYYR